MKIDAFALEALSNGYNWRLVPFKRMPVLERYVALWTNAISVPPDLNVTYLLNPAWLADDLVDEVFAGSYAQLFPRVRHYFPSDRNALFGNPYLRGVFSASYGNRFNVSRVKPLHLHGYLTRERKDSPGNRR